MIYLSLALLPNLCGAQPDSLPSGTVTVGQFGAVGDGETDDTESFQAALDSVAEVGGTVLVEPAEPGGGYVLTRRVALPRGTSLIGSAAGMPFFLWEGVDRELQRGPVILARPAESEYLGDERQPLFHLSGGNTIRGLYILYDEQPWPSDDELRAGDFAGFGSEESFIERFVPERVAPHGPTIMIQAGTASSTIEDITCSRYYDFLYMPGGGKIVVRRCYLYGYGRAFAGREVKDTIRISEIHLVPNVQSEISWQHSLVHAAITTHPDNIAFDFAEVDGFSVTDVTAFLIHTGFKLGASEAHPFVDPVRGEQVWTEWGTTAWGSISNIKLDNCAVGFDCVMGTILPNQLSNIMVHVSIDPGQKLTLEEEEVAHQAAFLIRPEFAGATLQVSNLSISSFAPTRVAANAAMVHQAGGRAFIIDCPSGMPAKDYASRDRAHIDIHGLVVSNIDEAHLLATSPGTVAGISVEGFVHNGSRAADGALEW